MNEEIQYIINSPYTSYWLRNAIFQLLDRDMLDARADAKLLYQLLDGVVKEKLDKECGCI
jgi:hypothetical protein